MPLRPPRAEPRLLPAAPLRSILTIARFPAELRLAQPASPLLVALQGRLRERYPRFGTEEQTGIAVGPQGLQIGQQAAWRFQELEGSWAVIVAPDFVGLETARPVRTDELVERLRDILVATRDVIQPPNREFFGLRYVYQIRPQEENPDWRRYISRELLGPLAGPVIDADVVTALQDVRVKQPDGIFSLKHGVIRIGTQAAYLLDYDYFNETPGPFDPEETATMARAFSTTTDQMLRWSLDPDYLEALARDR